MGRIQKYIIGNSTQMLCITITLVTIVACAPCTAVAQAPAGFCNIPWGASVDKAATIMAETGAHRTNDTTMLEQFRGLGYYGAMLYGMETMELAFLFGPEGFFAGDAGFEGGAHGEVIGMWEAVMAALRAELGEPAGATTAAELAALRASATDAEIVELIQQRAATLYAQWEFSDDVTGNTYMALCMVNNMGTLKVLMADTRQLYLFSSAERAAREGEDEGENEQEEHKEEMRGEASDEDYRE